MPTPSFQIFRHLANLLGLLALLIGQTHSATDNPANNPSDQVSYKIFASFLPPTLPPYHWYDPCNNEPQGSKLHILARAAEQAGIKLDIHYLHKLGQWPDRQKYYQQVKDGKYDGLWGYALRFNDSSFVSSKQAFSSYDASVLINNSFTATTINTEQLKNKTAVLMTVGSSAYFMRHLKSLGIATKEVKTLQEVFFLVHNNDQYFSIMDRYFANSRLTSLPAIKNLKFVNWTNVNLARNLYFIVNKDSPLRKKLPQLDQAYEEFYQQGYVDFINKTYTTLWLQNDGCIGKRNTNIITTTPID